MRSKWNKKHVKNVSGTVFGDLMLKRLIKQAEESRPAPVGCAFVLGYMSLGVVIGLSALALA